MVLLADEKPYFRTFSLIKGYSLTLCAEEPVDAYMGELAFELQKGISMLWPPQGLPPRAGAGEI
jgi:hypothetical protein